jgi:hypothetical protein
MYRPSVLQHKDINRRFEAFSYPPSVFFPFVYSDLILEGQSALLLAPPFLYRSSGSKPDSPQPFRPFCEDSKSSILTRFASAFMSVQLK